LKAEGHDRINVLNNPVNWIDPWGLEAGTITAGTIVSGGTTGAITIGGGGILGIAAGLVLGLPSETAGPELDMLPPYLEARKKKYEKPENPNKRKGADERKQSGERERNVGHPDGEEHSRRPKGGSRCP